MTTEITYREVSDWVDAVSREITLELKLQADEAIEQGDAAMGLDVQFECLNFDIRDAVHEHVEWCEYVIYTAKAREVWDCVPSSWRHAAEAEMGNYCDRAHDDETRAFVLMITATAAAVSEELSGIKESVEDIDV